MARTTPPTVVAVLGTTISPYLFFWQASQEVEDTRRRAERALRRAHPEYVARAPARIRLDTYVGMGFSNLIALFIILATAATLNAHGMTDIETSSQAAEALKPIAGNFAFLLFALGIIGTGLLAVPVLAGSAAYAVSELFGWRRALARLPRGARLLPDMIAATVIGMAMSFGERGPDQGARLERRSSTA